MYKLLIILMCLFVLIVGKSLVSNWINPGYILILYWTIFLSLVFLVMDDSHKWEYSGLIWLICAVFVFFIGSLLGINYVKNKKKNIVRERENGLQMELTKKSWTFLKGIIVIGIIRAIIEVGINGFSMQMFFNLDSLVEMNTSMAARRYSGGTETNVIMQLLLIFVYTAPLCGGYSFVYSKNKSQKLISVSTFIPIILSMLLTNGKAGVVASVCYWVSGLFVAYLEKHKKSPEIKFNVIIKTFAVLLLIFIALFTSMMLRVGDFSSETFKIISEKFGTYSFGSIVAFDNWFNNKPDIIEYTLGKYTFSFIFEILGISQLPQGVYEDAIMFSNGTYTNIYTVFRGIINDFGLLGSYLFLFLSGIVSGFTLQIVIVNRNVSNLTLTLLAAIYFFIFYSLLVSAWTYTSYMIAFIIFLFYLKISRNTNKL